MISASFFDIRVVKENVAGCFGRYWHHYFIVIVIRMTFTLPEYPQNRSPRLRLADVPDSDQSESGTSI